MKIIYDSDLARCFKPGERAWAAGFRLAKTCRKITKHLPPTLVECYHTPGLSNEELRARADGLDALYLVPVDEITGEPDLAHVHNPGDLHVERSRDDAVAAYVNDIREAQLEIEKRAKEIDDMRERMNEYLKKTLES